MNTRSIHGAAAGKDPGETFLCAARKVLLPASTWRCVQQMNVAVCAALLPALLPAAPLPPIGRLLLSIQQRQGLDAGQLDAAALLSNARSLERGEKKSATGTHEVPAPAARPLRFDGYCRQPSGISVWLNGEEFRSGQQGPYGLQISGVNPHSQLRLRVGQRLLHMGVGDVFHPASGRIDVLSPYRSVILLED